MGKVLFEFSHENSGLEGLHFHGEPKQLKIGLPLAFSELPKQNLFQKIKRLIQFIADINYVQNVLKDLLGQTGQNIGIPELLRFYAFHGELSRWGRTRRSVPPHCKGKAWPERSLPPRQSDHCQIETCYERKQKRGQPKQLQGIVPRKKEGMEKPPWKLNKEKQMTHENKTNKIERCTNCVRVQQNLIVELQVLKRNLCEKYFWVNVVVLGVHAARLVMNTKRGRKRKRLALCTARTCERRLYSEQYKRYNLYNLCRGHHCGRAVSRTAVRTAIVYCCIHSGLYIGTVHSVQWCWSTKYCSVLGLVKNQVRRQPPQILE
jgi:hypothetical protein